MVNLEKLFTPTRLEMFERCGQQFFYRYLEGKVVPPPAKAAWGRAGHKAMQHSLNARLRRGTLTRWQNLLDVFRDTLEYEFTGVDERHYGDTTGKRVLKGKLVHTGIHLLNIFHSNVAPLVKPTATEAAVTYTVKAEGELVQVTTHMDVLTQRMVLDHKWTGRTPPEHDALDNGHQGIAYYLGFTKLRKRPPARVRFDYYVGMKHPKLAQRELKPAKWRAQRFFRRLAYMARAIRQGNFHPAPPGAWWCSRQWCGYWGQCPYGGKRK